jgi:hypothetical protein
MSKAKRFAVGDLVRLTGSFLRSTGQYTGPDAHAKWTVQDHQGCRLCADGRFVLTNEPRQADDMFSAAEMAADPTLAFRHVNASNLERCR